MPHEWEGNFGGILGLIESPVNKWACKKPRRILYSTRHTLILGFKRKAIEMTSMGQFSGLVHFAGRDGTVEDGVADSFYSRVVLIHDILISQYSSLTPFPRKSLNNKLAHSDSHGLILNVEFCD